MTIKEAMTIFGIKNLKDINHDLIEKEYRKLAKKYHPDTSTIKDSQDKFQQINEAHQLLKTFSIGSIKKNDCGIDAFDKSTLFSVFNNILDDFESNYNGFRKLFKDEISSLINAAIKRYEHLSETNLYVTNTDLETFIDNFYTKLMEYVHKYQTYCQEKNKKISTLLKMIGYFPEEYIQKNNYISKVELLKKVFNFQELDNDYNLLYIKIKNELKFIAEKKHQEDLDTRICNVKNNLMQKYITAFYKYNGQETLEESGKYAEILANLIKNLSMVKNGKRPEQKLDYYDSITFDSMEKDKLYSNYIIGNYEQASGLIVPHQIDNEDAIAIGSILYPIINYNGKLYKLRPLSKDEIIERPLFDEELIDHEIGINEIISYKNYKTFVKADNNHSVYNPTAKDIFAFINTKDINSGSGFVVSSIPQIIYDQDLFSYNSFYHKGKVDLIKGKTK